MYAAKRSLTADDLAMAFERYKKLEQGTARNIVKFFMKRMELRKLLDRAQTSAAKPAAKTSGKKRATERGSRERNTQLLEV